MYPVSNDYKEKIAARTVTSNWYGTITTTGGAVINFNRENLDQNQSKLTRQYVTGETLELGNAYSSQLSLGLRGDYDKYQFYGASIVVYFRLMLSDVDYEDVPCGTFVVTDAEFSYNSVKLEAYDYMQRFSGKMTGEMEDGTPYAGLSAICTVCGVTLGNTQAEIEAMVNGTVVLPYSLLDSSQTYRDAVGYIAAILCGNAVIGRDNKLYIKTYTNTDVRELGVSARYSSTYIDYIGRYTTLALTNADGEEELYTVSGQFAETQLNISVGSNPLLNGLETRPAMAQAIINALSAIVYAPCTISSAQDPSLDIGDTLTISGGNIETPVKVIITKMEAKLYGQMQLVSAGGTYTLADVKTKNEAMVQQLPKKIEEAKKETQEKIDEITYDYLLPQVTSTDPISDGGDAIIMAFYFKLENTARVRFGSTINFETARDGDDLVHLHVIYNVDNTPLNPNDPLIQYYEDGHHILTLDFLTDELAAGSHTFGVAFGVTGGTLS